MENNQYTVVVTGASRGIGKAIAEIYAAHGATLFLCGRNEEVLNKTRLEISTKHAQSHVYARSCDLSVKAQAIEFGNWVLEHNTPHVLINNAGTYLPGNVLDEQEDVLQKQLDTNLFSAYHVTRTMAPDMIKRKAGHIVNIASIAGLQAYAGGGAYSISKHALIGFSRNLRLELMPHHIGVTTVMPGAVLTDSWGNFDNSKHRIMEAQDIAKLVFNATQLSPGACVEEIVVRPVLGDL